MSANKLFSVSPTDKLYQNLPETEKRLVDNGIELTKKFAGRKVADKKGSFAEMLDSYATGSKDDYKEHNDKFVTALFKHCMARGGFDVSNFNVGMMTNPMITGSNGFKESFALVVSQILSPVVPALATAAYLDWADVRQIGWGDTAAFEIKNNDTFYVTKIGEGVLEGTIQRLYDDVVTVNTELYNIKTTVDWYHVASGMLDFGEWVYRVGLSFSNYISLMVIDAIQGYAEAGVTAGNAYYTSGFSTPKFATMVDRLQAANPGSRIRAYGTLSALQAIIPEGTAGSSIANMQFQLGEEWSKVGYIGEYKGVDLVRIPQIILPNTVNNQALLGIPDDVVYLFADGGYKPVKLVFEGEPITINILPMDRQDKEMGVNVTMRFGQTLIVASKFGAITDVSLTV